MQQLVADEYRLTFIGLSVCFPDFVTFRKHKVKSNSLFLVTSAMASPNITSPQKPEAGANGGSRESSEFEFVGGGHGHQPRPLHPTQPQPPAAVNPLLMSSNVPAPSPVCVQAAVPSVPHLSPASITAPSPPHAMPHSMSAPENIDQTAVTRVTAESPAAPGAASGYLLC